MSLTEVFKVEHTLGNLTILHIYFFLIQHTDKSFHYKDDMLLINF